MDDADVEVPEAVELVADETRARILYVLSRQLKEDPEEPWVRFSELRRRVGMRDSGNFNYHLGKLAGRYVVEHPEGDGYRLAYPGMMVVAALVGGEYGATEELGPEPYDEPCPVCGGDLAVRYEGGVVHVDCEDVDAHGMAYNLPSHAVEAGKLDAAARLMASRAYAESALLFDGRCPLCFGAVDHRVAEQGSDVSPAFQYTCGRCGNHYSMLVGMAAMHHPRVVGFYDDHGVDLRSEPAELLVFAREDRVRRLDDGGFEVTLELDGDALVVAVGEDATVRSVEHRS
jgi:hypothetical protein